MIASMVSRYTDAAGKQLPDIHQFSGSILIQKPAQMPFRRIYFIGRKSTTVITSQYIMDNAGLFRTADNKKNLLRVINSRKGERYPFFGYPLLRYRCG